LLSGLVILIVSLALIVRQANWAAIAADAKESYLKESLFFRSSTLVQLDDMTYTRRLLANHLNSSSSAAGDEEERSSSLENPSSVKLMKQKNIKVIFPLGDEEEDVPSPNFNPRQYEMQGFSKLVVG
jgi:hypothetical protein